MKTNLKTLINFGRRNHNEEDVELVQRLLDLKIELQNLLKRERYPEKGYCPVWDNAFDYAIKEILGDT